MTIKWYYFPTTQNKHIKIEDIKCVYYKEQVRFADMFKIKGWGMSLSPIWWACDLCRYIDLFNLLREKIFLEDLAQQIILI